MSDLPDAIAIPLKQKYLHGFRSSQKSGSNRSGAANHHHKLNDKQKKLLPPQPKKVMVLKDGRCRMMVVDE